MSTIGVCRGKYCAGLILPLIFLSVATILCAAPSVNSRMGQSQLKKTVRYLYHGRVRYMMLSDLANYYGMTLSYTKTGVVIRNRYNNVEFEYNKRSGAINGVTVYFLSPLLIRDGVAYLSDADYQNVLEPVFRKEYLVKHNLKTIMIDPGHGGKDRGASGPVSDEKTINLQIAKKLANELADKGFKIIMTRTNDSFPSLQDRAELCEKYKPDLFLSIHCNSTSGKNVSGVETYAMTPAGSASTADTQPSSVESPGNRYDKNNYRLAYEIQRALVSSTKADDRGVKHARFYVLRNATAPSVLIEAGFLSNDREGRLLSQKERQDRIVSAIVLALTRYASLIRN